METVVFEMIETTPDQTRERLLEAAGEIFARQGFQGATIREICQLGKANLAAVNYHFGDKQSLYYEAVERAHCGGAGLIGVEWPQGWTPQQKLRAFIRRWLDHYLDDSRPSWQMRLMLREMSEPTDACAKLVQAYIRPMANVLRGIVEELLPAGHAERQSWLTGFSIVGQCLFYKVHRPIVELLVGQEEYSHLSIELLADHIASFSLAALGQGSSITSQPPAELMAIGQPTAGEPEMGQADIEERAT